MSIADEKDQAIQPSCATTTPASTTGPKQPSSSGGEPKAQTYRNFSYPVPFVNLPLTPTTDIDETYTKLLSDQACVGIGIGVTSEVSGKFVPLIEKDSQSQLTSSTHSSDAVKKGLSVPKRSINMIQGTPTPPISPSEWGSPNPNHCRPDSEYGFSMSGDEGRPSISQGLAKPTERPSRKPKWLSSVKDWLTINEPSAQAMKQQKDQTYKKIGLDMNDPRAAAKLHLPMGQIPAGATTSTKGPSPEQALKKTVEQRKKRESYMGNNQTSNSLSSGFSSTQSVREVNHVAPWDT